MPAFFVLLLLYVVMPSYQVLRWNKTGHVINWFDVMWLAIYVIVVGTSLHYLSIYLGSKS